MGTMAIKGRLAWFALAVVATACVAQANVYDGAQFFSAGAVADADKAIAAIAGPANLELIVETYAKIPAERAATLPANATEDQKRQFYLRWLQDRAKQRHARGVFVLICKQPARIEVYATADSAAKFPAAKREAMFAAIQEEFKARRFDQGLARAVQIYGQTLRGGGGVTGVQGVPVVPGGPVRPVAPAPPTPAGVMERPQVPPAKHVDVPPPPVADVSPPEKVGGAGLPGMLKFLTGCTCLFAIVLLPLFYFLARQGARAQKQASERLAASQRARGGAGGMPPPIPGGTRGQSFTARRMDGGPGPTSASFSSGVDAGPTFFDSRPSLGGGGDGGSRNAGFLMGMLGNLFGGGQKSAGGGSESSLGSSHSNSSSVPEGSGDVNASDGVSGDFGSSDSGGGGGGGGDSGGGGGDGGGSSGGDF